MFSVQRWDQRGYDRRHAQSPRHRRAAGKLDRDRAGRLQRLATWQFPSAIAANVDAILSRLRARQVQVVLCGFYDEPWDAIAKRHDAIFVPSSSCYDAANRGWDGLHMNADGIEW
jgi:hypothetical protein